MSNERNEGATELAKRLVPEPQEYVATLRDQFAMAAMPHFLAAMSDRPGASPPWQCDSKSAMEMAYEAADFALDVRKVSRETKGTAR